MAAASARARDFEVLDNVLLHHESTVDVGSFAFDGKFGLGAGGAAALKDVCSEFGAKDGGHFARNDLCLVVAPGPFASPVQGDRDYCINVCKMLRRGYLFS